MTIASKHEDLQLITQRDACRLLNIAPPTAWRWQKRGILRPVRIAGRPRYRLSDIRALTESGEISE